ncbi:MAG: hypothetical protein U0892_08785 [Pirellulales bacterium]
MLRYRLLSALIVVSLAFGFVALDGLWPIHADCHGVWMSALAVFLMFGSAMECTILLRHRPVPFDARPALFGTAGIMAASLVPMLWPLSGEPYPADCPLTPLGWPLAAVVISAGRVFRLDHPILQERCRSRWNKRYSAAGSRRTSAAPLRFGSPFEG